MPIAGSRWISISRLWGMKNEWIRFGLSGVCLKGVQFSTLGGYLKDDVTSISQ